MSYKQFDATTLKGEKIKSAVQVGDDEIRFETESGRKLRMHHNQDCCESVKIHDIKGGVLQDLVGFTIVQASETSTRDRPEDVKDIDYADYSETWTTYKFETLTNTIQIRWFGTSNGYYGESVDLDEVGAF